MILLVVLLLFGVCKPFPWNTSVLQNKPWPVDHCTPLAQTCIDVEPKECLLTCSSIEDCTVHVAVILPDDKFYIVNLKEAVDTLKQAERDAISLGILDSRIQFQYKDFDDMCKQEYATVRIISASSEFCANVIFGPICDYCLASAGRVAKYLGNHGTPLISPGGFTFDFTNKKNQCSDEFYMVMNSGASDYRSYAEFFHLIMDRYKWRKLALLYEKDQQDEVGGEQSCQLLMKSIIEEMKTVPHLDFYDGDLKLTGHNYTEYLQRVVGVHYGIILVCTSVSRMRDIAIEAFKLNMMESGEYTFFNFELYNNAPTASEPWFVAEDLPDRNEIAKKAFKSVFTFTPISETNFDEIQKSKRRGSSYLDGLYDGMLLYINAINQSMQKRNGNLSGYIISQNMMGVKFRGKNGEVTMNCNGQRVAEYAMLNINSSGQYDVVSTYTNLDKNITSWRVEWLKGDPSDTPLCGYDMSLCPPYDTVNILLISLILVLCLGILIVAIISYRHFKLKAAIYSMAWKINHDDIIFLPIKARSSFQSTASLHRGSQITLLEMDGMSVAGDRQLYTTVGYYKSIRVAVKYLREVKIEPTHQQLIELKTMKDLSNDNLVKFYGACLDIPNCILTEYCPKGSLQDILENESVKLEWTFRMSLMMDVVRGMNYLHHSAVKSHGALTSTNCLVDSRFVLKIADFGLHFLRRHAHEDEDDMESHSYWERQLWTAPELLRLQHPPPEGTQKGDIYSFAIIMNEIICRQGAFHLEEFKNARDTNSSLFQEDLDPLTNNSTRLTDCREQVSVKTLRGILRYNTLGKSMDY